MSHGSSIGMDCATPKRADAGRAWGRVLVLAFMMSSVMISGSARGEDPLETRFDRWQPSAQLAIGLHNQTVTVRGSSTLGASSRASRAILTSLFSLNGGLTSPAVVSGFGNPRVYFRGGYKFPVADEPRLLDEDTAVDPLDFQGDPSVCGMNFPPATQSCEHNLRVDLQIQDLWNAGVGVQFTVPFRGVELKLDVGLEYLGEKLQYTGTATRIDRGVGLGGAGEILATTVLPRAVRSDYVHTLGPRSALSVNVAQFGPFQVLFNLETTFYFYPSELDTRFGGSTGADSQSFQVESKQPFITQAAGGVSFLWY